MTLIYIPTSSPEFVIVYLILTGVRVKSEWTFHLKKQHYIAENAIHTFGARYRETKLELDCKLLPC